MAWPLAAMGIGALIGGLGAKQRGGNFLEGAITGGALGGITGGFGAKFGGGEGGIFGFGKEMLPNFLAMSGIGMGTEMFGQQEANKAALEGRRQLFNEEEEERLRRLREIAGYDIADSKNFLTPQSYFGVADGGIINTRQGFYNGGGAWADIPMEEGGPTMDPEIMRLPMGQEGSFEEENEGIVGLELAGLTDEEMSELQALQSLSIVTTKDDPQYERIQIRLQELMGRMKVAKGGHINRPGYNEGGITEIASASHPDEGYYNMFFDEHGRYPKDKEELEIFLEGMDLDTFQAARGGRVHARRGMYLPNEVEEEGFQYDVDIDGDKYSFGFDEELTEDNDKRKKIIEMIMRQKIGEYEHPLGEPGMGEYEHPIGKPGMGEYEHPLGKPGMGEYEFKAAGGIADLDMRGGGESIGPGTGTSDDVPAMLSDGEFVMTANAVSNLGGGDRMVGAKRMYQMMNQLDPNSQSPGEMNVAGYG